MKSMVRVAFGTALLVILGFGVVVMSTTPSPVSAQAPGATFCGGIAGIQCPDGYMCVDDPRDDCNPKRGGADCAGICKRTH